MALLDKGMKRRDFLKASAAQRLGRRGDGALADDGDEIAERSQFHGSPFDSPACSDVVSPTSIAPGEIGSSTSCMPFKHLRDYNISITYGRGALRKIRVVRKDTRRGG